jgi:hypothetical protein
MSGRWRQRAAELKAAAALEDRMRALVDREDCATCAGLLDWIFQVASRGETTVSNDSLGQLIRLIMPSWMKPVEPEPRLLPSARPAGSLDKHCEAALDSAIKAIVEAPDGQHALAVYREAFSIGTLVEAGMPASLALQALHWAASQLTSRGSPHPWPLELE